MFPAPWFLSSAFGVWDLGFPPGVEYQKGSYIAAADE